MCFIHQGLRDFAFDTWEADVESSTQKITAVREVQVHFGIDGQVRWQRYLLLASYKPNRTFEAGRPAGSEQLLRIGTDVRRARGR